MDASAPMVVVLAKPVPTWFALRSSVTSQSSFNVIENAFDRMRTKVIFCRFCHDRAVLEVWDGSMARQDSNRAESAIRTWFYGRISFDNRAFQDLELLCDRGKLIVETEEIRGNRRHFQLSRCLKSTAIDPRGL